MERCWPTPSALGAAVEEDTVDRGRQRGDRAAGVVGERGRYARGDVVIAAGAWSGQIEGMPRPVAVAPVRGQMAALPWPAGARRAIVYGHGCYLVARGDEAIVGSTMEYVGFRPESSSAGLARIFARCPALCPALDRAKVRRTWAGLRPVTPDGLPIIGAEPRLTGSGTPPATDETGSCSPAHRRDRAPAARRRAAGQDIDAYAPTRFWPW